ncbi:MAG: Disulfide-bond oxidoreductase YfcG [Alphaproteobacteria bacterium MarineAlpha11_Bin1]|nr:MAG: Disulfide-bond oxidoreductase YfcG [Alphaproteobacteria bacterium MarineAlpha11_Bin1]|tara:strand:+ start:3631 stop:4239 length:609 start_codon:yes stop_codon:yes gene_type:complete
MLEECGLDYCTHIIDITAGDQYAPEFLKISANGRIPAIVDPEGPDGKTLSLFESGAILLYLAEKTGMFMPGDEDGYWSTVQWLMWQMGGIGPNFGQAFHFLYQHPDNAQDDDIAYGRKRYAYEVDRLCKVMDRELADKTYLTGGVYSIADIAIFPWIALHSWVRLDFKKLPNLRRWYEEVGDRPGVHRGMDTPTREEIGDLV